MKYLFLGGSGFIGQRLIRKIHMDDRVVVADRVFPEELKACSNIEFKSIDFASDDLYPILQDVDVVVHLLATVIPAEGTENIVDEISSDVIPTIHLMDAMIQKKTPKIIFVSSGGAVYGESEGIPIREDFGQLPICKYGVHKLAVEKYMHLYNVNHGLDYRVVRLSNPYSSKVFAGRMQGVIPIFIDKILKNEPIAIWGDGSAERDYIHIDDAVAAIFAVLKYAGPRRVFNIGTGVGISLNNLISLISDAVGGNPPMVHYYPARNCDVMKNTLDISKIRECTGWEPKISLTGGIKMCVDERKKW